MKKALFMMAAIAAMACSCNPDSDCLPCQKEDQNEATLEVNLDFEDDQTKATSYVTAQAYETAVNDVQILVFDASGMLNAYVDAGTKTGSISIKTTAGTKTVWGVVNGPDLSAITTLSALENTAITLAANSTTSTKGFVMAGSVSCNAGGTSSLASVPVRRMVSRIALQKVTNSLPASYGSITINNVTLTNVVGNQNIAGNAAITTWYNKAGRKEGSDNIIDGTSNLATCPELTFKSVGTAIANGKDLTPTTPYLFYCYPNSTTTDATGWSSTFTARKTRLVVAATIAGKKYYYPVVLDTPARNTAYTVELTISGLGATDPDYPVETAAITGSVTVQGWSTGTVYEETI